MKTFQRYFSIFVVLLISIVSINQITLNQASAQCPSPPPDCLMDPFVAGPPIVINDGACTITITWCWRIACGIWHDMVITSITYSGICPGALSPAQVQDEALKEAIRQNPWGASIPPCPQQSQITWRLGKLACVAEYEIIGSGGWILLWPCEPQSRCWEMFTSCYTIGPNGNHVIHITKVGDSFPAIPCSQTSTPENLPFSVILRRDCYDICN